MELLSRDNKNGIVLKDKTKVSLSPPEWEPITLDDIIAGPDEIA